MQNIVNPIEWEGKTVYMSQEDPTKAEHKKPLPFRREFRKVLIPLLEKGTVLVTERRSPEWWDAQNAAQTILINHLHPKIVASFKRPALPEDGNLYQNFAQMYVKEIDQAEKDAWAVFGSSFSEKFARMNKDDLDNLTDAEAAYLTLSQAEDVDSMPSSQELFEYLPRYTEVYEGLLKKKYGENYEPERLYVNLRTKMPQFLLKFIAMDSLLVEKTNLYGQTELDEDADLVPSDFSFNPAVFELTEDDNLVFTRRFVDFVHNSLEKKDVKDSQGRTEDRGCPVLFAEKGVRDTIINFAIEELISQHEASTQRR